MSAGAGKAAAPPCSAAPIPLRFIRGGVAGTHTHAGATYPPIPLRLIGGRRSGADLSWSNDEDERREAKEGLDVPIGFWGSCGQGVLPAGRVATEVTAARAAAAARTPEFRKFEARCRESIRLLGGYCYDPSTSGADMQKAWAQCICMWHGPQALPASAPSASSSPGEMSAAWHDPLTTEGKAEDEGKVQPVEPVELPEITVITGAACELSAARCITLTDTATDASAGAAGAAGVGSKSSMGSKAKALCVTGVARFKHSRSTTPAMGMPQAVVAACSAAVHLLSLGLPASDCVVPFVISAGGGRLEQHGMAYLLEPCAPCAVLTSHVIDITDTQDTALITARWVTTMVANETERLIAPLLASPRPLSRIEPAISQDLYFFKKPLAGLVGRTKERAFFHLNEVFKALSRSPAASEYCVLPLATFMRDPRAGLEDSLEPHDPAAELVMAFPNVELEGFTSGIPNHAGFSGPDYEDFDMLERAILRGLERALKAIHAAGLVHCDVYPHNVMWRRRRLTTNSTDIDVSGDIKAEGEGEVDVLLVDWDASLFIGQPVSRGAEEMLEGSGQAICYHPTLMKADQPASPQLDWWHYHMLRLRAPFGGDFFDEHKLDCWMRMSPVPELCEAGATACKTRREYLIALAEESAAAEAATTSGAAGGMGMYW